MAFLASLCCCIPTNKQLHQPQQPPYNHQAGLQNGPTSLREEVGMNPYMSTATLPRYSPRPVSLHEKTVDGERRQSSESHHSSWPRDEKDPRIFEHSYHPDRPLPRNHDDRSSDASSTISATDSFGNTSTATRDTPPPPYSPAPSHRSRSVSVLTHGTGNTYVSFHSAEIPAPMIEIPQPQPALHRARFIHPGTDLNVEDRRSWEGRRSPPFPTTYGRRGSLGGS